MPELSKIAAAIYPSPPPPRCAFFGNDIDIPYREVGKVYFLPSLDNPLGTQVPGCEGPKATGTPCLVF